MFLYSIKSTAEAKVTMRTEIRFTELLKQSTINYSIIHFIVHESNHAQKGLMLNECHDDDRQNN